MLLSGAARGVGVKGHIHGGKVIREPPRRRPRTRTLVFGGAATLLLSGLLAEPGVIGNGPGKYHFWAVEYLYSYGTPPANSLAAAFLGYLNSYAAKTYCAARAIYRARTAGSPPCRPSATGSWLAGGRTGG